MACAYIRGMRMILLASLMLASPALAAAPAESAHDLAASRAKLARIEMRPDTSYLSSEERQVINLLIQAANEMSGIYLRQNYAENPRSGTRSRGAGGRTSRCCSTCST